MALSLGYLNCNQIKSLKLVKLLLDLTVALQKALHRSVIHSLPDYLLFIYIPMEAFDHQILYLCKSNSDML